MRILITFPKILLIGRNQGKKKDSYVGNCNSMQAYANGNEEIGVEDYCAMV